MNKNFRKRPGSVSLEFIVTLFLMLMLFVLLTETMFEVGRANRRQWARKACMNAAGAQLDCYAALGRPLDPNEAARLWPNVSLFVQIDPGDGPWQGLYLVRVRAQQRIHRRNIQIQQCRYIRLPGEERP
jgi:hypothetical protein